MALEDCEDEEKSESLELVASSLSSDELEDKCIFPCLSTECDLEPNVLRGIAFVLKYTFC